MNTDEAVREFFAGRPPLDRLLFAALKHRLFLAFLLVGKLSLPPQEVLGLRWPMVDLAEGGLLLPSMRIQLEESLVELFALHAARQRQDRRKAPAWISPGRVMVDHFGCPYLTLDADTVLAGYCRDLNFPEVTLATIGQLDLL